MPLESTTPPLKGSGSDPVIRSTTVDLAASDLSDCLDPKIYAYLQDDAPDNLVINAGLSAIIVAGEAVLGSASPRMDPGERRRGRYYLETIMPKIGQVQLVKNIPQNRLNELEKKRQQAAGIAPADWIVRAREKEKLGIVPGSDGGVLDAKEAAKRLSQMAMGVE